MIVGPKRSGKGTIVRTLRALVGESNVAAPTLSSLAGPFGSQQLIGKTVAVCTESRLSGRADTQAIVERLLSISGEDPQAVDRKHLTTWHGVLRTRFVLTSNELPRLGDYSGALPGRVVLLELERSFFGHEDHKLEAKLLAELPGILAWSLEGWKRLRERGYFVQPKSALGRLQELEELTNPLGAFLAECCQIDHNARSPVQEVFAAWQAWCRENGREHSGDVQGLSRNLRTAVPSIDIKRPRGNGCRFRVFTGISLKPAVEASY
jgi:putative DNA primase/helicase